VRDAALWLGDMAAFTAEALALAKGRKRADLETDRALELQLTHLILRIGEAASHVPEADRVGIEIPWRGIVAMRNRLVHAYFQLDHDLLWQAVEDGLPQIHKALRGRKKK
jgi:uncharacterized protein with HEPN domain